MFTFQFDAPKYKCFGGNEPRRSTITDLDSTNSNDRWFLTFDRPNSWKQLFRKLFDENQQDKQQKQIINTVQIESKQSQNVKSELPIIVKKSPFMLKKNNQIHIPNDRHKVILKSLDSKHQQKNRKKPHPSSLTMRQQPIKPSKSQPNLQKPNEQKRRNPPCLYPIRIQRQWEQAHGKKWYQLTSQQLIQAQKSMKKRLLKTTSLASKSVKIEQRSQSQNKSTKIKQKDSTNLNENISRSVRNPFYGMGERFKK